MTIAKSPVNTPLDVLISQGNKTSPNEGLGVLFLTAFKEEVLIFFPPLGN
jgi:hypothetical protein